MRNCAEWLVAFLAIIRAGGVAVLVNSRASGPDLVAMIEDTSPALVLADTRRADDIRAAGYGGRVIDLTRQLDRDADDRPVPVATPDANAARPDDPCAILFTSGTTGRSKGAVLSHRGVITGLMNTQLTVMVVLHNLSIQTGVPVAQLMAQMPQQASLLVSPLFHVSGFSSSFLSPFLAGSKVVVMHRWDAQEAVRLIEREAITIFSGVPTMLWDIIHRAKTAEFNIASLRNIGCGGQALPVNLVHEIQALCPDAQIGTGYGMTECSGAIAQSVGPGFMRKPAAAGQILPLVDVRIEGPDGEPLPIGASGEIVVRGAQVMTAYWNRPEDTAAVLSPDGWLRTGDIGFVDEDGYITIVDRKKDMVISGGENIYCAEVERVMSEIAEVRECAAFGIPGERLGEAPVAVVFGEGLTETRVRDWVSERLAQYKTPVRVAFSKTELPRNAVGKIDKIALRGMWNSLIGDN